MIAAFFKTLSKLYVLVKHSHQFLLTLPLVELSYYNLFFQTVGTSYRI